MKGWNWKGAEGDFGTILFTLVDQAVFGTTVNLGKDIIFPFVAVDIESFAIG